MRGDELHCSYLIENGGGRGIRTPESLSTLTVFKTGAFNRSAIPPFSILSDFFILRGVSHSRFGLFGLPGHHCHSLSQVGNLATARAFVS
jgi:hypothetical protein